jgi:serine protease Do
MAPGTSVKLGVIHQGQEKTVTLTLGTLPNEKQAVQSGRPARFPIATCRSSA